MPPAVQTHVRRKAIAPGNYLLRFALGNDWDPVLNRFQKNVSFSVFEDPFEFEYTNGLYTTGRSR